MYLNDKYIAEYGGVLVDYSVSGIKVTSNYLKSARSSSISLFSQYFGNKKIKLEMEFHGRDRSEATHKVSEFIKALSGSIEIVLPDNFLYKAILMNVSNPVFPFEEMAEIEVELLGTQHLPIQTVELTNSGIITADGTLETDCIIEIMSATTIANFKINGITIFTLTANKPFVIDGISKKVTDNGVNAILKTDMVEFPKLNPGENAVILSNPAAVTIKYYPTFL